MNKQILAKTHWNNPNGFHSRENSKSAGRGQGTYDFIHILGMKQKATKEETKQTKKPHRHRLL